MRERKGQKKGKRKKEEEDEMKRMGRKGGEVMRKHGRVKENEKKK